MFFNNFLGIKIPPKWDFPGGPGVKNLPSSAGDVGSISVWENKTPYTAGLLSPCAKTREFVFSKS